MEDAISQTDEVYFLGDFYVNFLSDGTQSRLWSHSLEAFDLSQLVKEATRVTAHSATLIDHVYTSQPDKVTECCLPGKSCVERSLSGMFYKTDDKYTTKRNHSSIKYRSYTRFDDAEFLDELDIKISKFKCPQTDSNMNFATWKALFLSVLNKHALIKEKRVKLTSKPVWLTEEITNTQQNRNNYHKKQDWEF